MSLQRQHDLLFRCPLPSEPLRAATAEEVGRINLEIQSGRRVCHDGTLVSRPVREALCTADLRYFYRVEDGVYWMLPSLAIKPAGETVTVNEGPEKAGVREFYDQYGWVKRDDGLYRDTADFTDTRPIARRYQSACNRRIYQALRKGEYLLDGASGAMSLPEHLDFSTNHTVRICLDFSIRALREAREKLGDRGLYVLGDITRLPFRDEAIDDVISLHTIYHVPQEQQATAVNEIVRVVKNNGRVVIVYVWPQSAAMDAVAWMRRIYGRLRRLGMPPKQAPKGAVPNEQQPSLFFCPQDFEWYRRDVAERHGGQLKVWAFADTFRALPEGPVGWLCLRAI
jgi:SAM-dependent methyltransferase